MHDNAANTDSPANTGTPSRTSVFLAWSDDSRAIATALKELLLATGGDRVDPFHSDDMEDADPWRDQIKKAVARSQVAVLSMVPASLDSTWLMYEAGAFFEGGDTFLLACGVDSEGLKNTPLEAFQLKDARNRKAVHGLARKLVKPPAAESEAFDKAFDASWEAFAAVVSEIHCKQESESKRKQEEIRRKEEEGRREQAELLRKREEARREREDRRKRTRLAWLGAALLTVVLVVAGIAGWHSRVSLQCGVVGAKSCADLRWTDFITQAATTKNPNLAKIVSRRPFAVVGVGPSCVAARMSAATIVGPDGPVGPQKAALIFAASTYDKTVQSGMALSREGAADVLLGAGCRALPNGQAIDVRAFGTLADDKLCEKATAIDQHFKSRWALTKSLGAFLTTLEIPDDRIRLGDLNYWLQQCGVP